MTYISRIYVVALTLLFMTTLFSGCSSRSKDDPKPAGNWVRVTLRGKTYTTVFSPATLLNGTNVSNAVAGETLATTRDGDAYWSALFTSNGKEAYIVLWGSKKGGSVTGEYEPSGTVTDFTIGGKTFDIAPTKSTFTVTRSDHDAMEGKFNLVLGNPSETTALSGTFGISIFGR